MTERLLKEIISELKLIEDEEEQLSGYRNEVNQAKSEISELEKELEENPSFELTKKISSLKQGLPALESSVNNKHEQFNKGMKSRLRPTAEKGAEYIREVTFNDPDVKASKERFIKAIQEVIQANEAYSKTFLNSRKQSMDKINELGLTKRSRDCDYAKDPIYEHGCHINLILEGTENFLKGLIE